MKWVLWAFLIVVGVVVVIIAMPTADGATLRITENGYVTNPLFRFMSRFVLGYTGEIEKYLRSLAKKFGEPPQIGE
jgi:hypothetical protein